MTTEDLAAIVLLAKTATAGPFSVMGDGRQVFVADSGIVANCDCQWADDDDEDGRYADEARGVANAEFFAELSPTVVLAWVDEAERMRAAMRHIAATADTLSPQEFINICAGALGVDRHEYGGECAPNRSLVEMRSLLSRVVDAFDRCDSNRGAFSCCEQHDCRCPKSRGIGGCECGRDQLEYVLTESRTAFSEGRGGTADSLPQQEQCVKDAAITIANLEEGIDELAAQNKRLLAALIEAKDQIARASVVEPCLVSAATTIRAAIADSGEANHGL
jgi:hypothetical protein